MVLERFLTELSDEAKPVRHTGLASLSGIAGEELGLFKSRWPALAVARRAEIVNKLVSLAEDTAELNFDAIFLHCLNVQFLYFFWNW